VRKVISSISWFNSVLFNAAYRFYWDDCFSRASALAYATLFALVPISALGLSMFSVFGMSSEDLNSTLRTILEQVLPPMQNIQLRQLQEQVFEALESFTLNVRALNVISIAALFFTAVALLNTIESALNVIWRVSSNLSILTKLTSFWAVLTLGPLFIAMSIYWTTKVKMLEIASDFGSVYALMQVYFVPISITWLGLTLLFYKLPAAKVTLGEATLGAFVSAFLFELIKRGFAYYVGLSSTYSTIYGVVATIPLFLFWLYLTWAIILFGAEVSYQAGAIHIMRGIRRYATDLGETGALLGLRILLSIGRSFRDGLPPITESEIAIDSGSDPVLVRTCLDVLANGGFISKADEETHSRTLLTQPEKITIGKVFEVFRSKKSRSAPQDHSIERVGDLLRDIVTFSKSEHGAKKITEWSLEDLLTQELELPASKENEWNLK
jgi:YihY family inner membrane protein